MVTETDFHPPRKKRMGKVEQTILAAVGTAGMLLVAAAAPNAVQLLSPILKRIKASSKQSGERAFYRLKERGYLVLETKKGKTYLRLSTQGRRHLDRLRTTYQRLGEKVGEIKKRLTWDGRWRIIAFDIHEYRRPVRDMIRRELQLFGMRRLQNSMWIYPYDCSDLVTLLKADYRVGKELLYIRSDQVENDGWLRKHFNLPIEED